MAEAYVLLALWQELARREDWQVQTHMPAGGRDNFSDRPY